MTTVTCRRREGGKGLTRQYYASAGNSLVKEGRLKERLTQRESACYAAGATKVEIAAARNGHEAFQVFVAAPAGNLKDVTIKKTPLVNDRAGRKIDPRHISFFVVESVKTRGRKPDKSWPDILMPYKRFDVPQGGLQPVWVSIRVPRGAAPGEYRGRIEVCPAGAASQTVQVKLTVWDFALPDKTSLATVFGFTTLDGMSGFYDFYPGSPQKQSAMVRKYLRFLNDRRINTLFYGYVTTRDPRIVSIKESKNGKLSYDFKKLDPYLRLLVDRGMRFNIFAPSFWQSAEAMFDMNPLLKERFGHLGQGVFDSPEFDRAVAELLDSYVKHLRRKGWLKNAFCYIWDEPPAGMYAHMRKMCEMVKKVAPDVPRMTVANHEPFDLEGLTDIWCPNLGQREPPGCYDRFADYYRRRKKAGDTVWWYLACEPHPFPNWFLDYPLLDCRIAFWLTWRYGLDGLGYWNTTAWHYDTPGTPHGCNFHPKAEDRWPNASWDPSWRCRCKARPCQGNGQLIYPGPAGPVSSMRLESIRNGIEDYEYLRLLERKTAALGRKRSTPFRQKLLRTSKRVLGDARRAANSAIDWERDGQKLLTLRGRIGRQIEALSRALRK